jgi:hypothetical protein
MRCSCSLVLSSVVVVFAIVIAVVILIEVICKVIVLEVIGPISVNDIGEVVSDFINEIKFDHPIN